MTQPKLLVLFIFFLVAACSAMEPAPPEAAEDEAMSRTEFTDTVENFFEYAPLKAGQPSQFRIHLTDLRDGSPVEGAEVVLTVRAPGSDGALTSTTALVGKVAGIYVADLTVPRAGPYDIEFRVKNSKLDEWMRLSDFKVE